MKRNEVLGGCLRYRGTLASALPVENCNLYKEPEVPNMTSVYACGPRPGDWSQADRNSGLCGKPEQEH